jgi:hypothetical protein
VVQEDIHRGDGRHIGPVRDIHLAYVLGPVLHEWPGGEAVRYTLILAAIRAVFLVRYTFGVLMELTNAAKRREEQAGG